MFEDRWLFLTCEGDVRLMESFNGDVCMLFSCIFVQLVEGVP